ncbi:hypothetical protein NH342_22315, partial [Klenkia sp. PcliD-1-E]|nr:hypothetical protein [Klenkia sp. PcliD-1-E]
RRSRWAALAVGQAALLAATAGLALDLLAPAPPAGPSATPSTGAGLALPDVLPTVGDGRPRPQTTAGAPVTTHGDPRGLTAGTGAIPPGTEVAVRCRVLAAPMPAAGAAGWWYLVESGTWSGQWALAGGFVPGADPGEVEGYRTDRDVPACTSPAGG